MCGIAGFVIKNNHSNIVPIDSLRNMAKVIEHRGPDDEGFYHDATTFLCHRRLSIIDLSSGHQPMISKDGRLVIVFNGEIYNFLEIKKQLISMGKQFHTTSDTEVLLIAFECWGIDCLEKLNGMFAFAIYDTELKKLYIARDRIGEKPLYYYNDANYFVFGSEIKAIFASGITSAEFAPQALDYYITLGYLPTKYTLFNRIQKLEPGNYAVIESGEIKITNYWQLNQITPFTGSFEDALAQLSSLFSDSLTKRLISDVPVGVFLSGGIDSAAVVAYISGVLGRKTSTFSLGFSDSPDLSELSNARTTAERYGTDHHEIILTHDAFIDALTNIIGYTEDPLVDESAIAVHQLSKAARKNAIVLLGGEGSDEVFAGYPLYLLMAWTEKIRKYSPSFMFSLIEQLPLAEKWLKYAFWCRTRIRDKYRSIPNDIIPMGKKLLYSEPFNRQYGTSTDQLFESIFAATDGFSNLQAMQYADIKSWLPDNLMLKGDKMTMAASIELRLPFLDHRIVEFGLSLPDEYKIRNGERKFILKKLMEGKVDHHIIYQKKKGFPLPIARWFRTDLYEIINDTLFSTNSLGRNYFNMDYIRKILQEHRDGKADHSRRILMLLTLEMWNKRYISTN